MLVKHETNLLIKAKMTIILSQNFTKLKHQTITGSEISLLFPIGTRILELTILQWSQQFMKSISCLLSIEGLLYKNRYTNTLYIFHIWQNYHMGLKHVNFNYWIFLLVISYMISLVHVLKWPWRNLSMYQNHLCKYIFNK